MLDAIDCVTTTTTTKSGAIRTHNRGAVARNGEVDRFLPNFIQLSSLFTLVIFPNISYIKLNKEHVLQQLMSMRTESSSCFSLR